MTWKPLPLYGPQRLQPAYRPAAATSGPSSQSWAYWLLPALIIAGAALYLLPKREETRTAQETNQVTPQPAPVKETAEVTPATAKEGAQIAAAAAKETAELTTIENDIATNIERLRVALPKVSDPASAETAVGEIREISNRLAQLRSTAQQLSAEARKSVSGALSAKMSDLNSILDRIIKEINYLSGEAKPAIDTLKTELADLSKA